MYYAGLLTLSGLRQIISALTGWSWYITAQLLVMWCFNINVRLWQMLKIQSKWYLFTIYLLTDSFRKLIVTYPNTAKISNLTMSLPHINTWLFKSWFILWLFNYIISTAKVTQLQIKSDVNKCWVSENLKVVSHRLFTGLIQNLCRDWKMSQEPNMG
jgi:hypothetical protein